MNKYFEKLKQYSEKFEALEGNMSGLLTNFIILLIAITLFFSCSDRPKKEDYGRSYMRLLNGYYFVETKYSYSDYILTFSDSTTKADSVDIILKGQIDKVKESREVYNKFLKTIKVREEEEIVKPEVWKTYVYLSFFSFCLLYTIALFYWFGKRRKRILKLVEEVKTDISNIAKLNLELTKEKDGLENEVAQSERQVKKYKSEVIELEKENRLLEKKIESLSSQNIPKALPKKTKNKKDNNLKKS